MKVQNVKKLEVKDMLTKGEMRDILKGRKVKLVSGKWCNGNEFSFKGWTRKDMLEHLQASYPLEFEEAD